MIKETLKDCLIALSLVVLTIKQQKFKIICSVCFPLVLLTEIEISFEKKKTETNYINFKEINVSSLSI